MLTNRGIRYFIRLAIAVGAIAAATMFTGVIQPSHAAGDVFATFLDSGEIVSGKPIISLDVPPGKYAIFGKINIDQDGGKAGDKLITVVCTLFPGNDTNVIRLDRTVVKGSKNLDNAAMSFQVVAELTSNYQISMSCTFPFQPLNPKLAFRFAKITAIRFDGSLCEKPSPAICNDAASDVLATFKESGSIVSGTPIVKLSVPTGKYAIFAKINLDRDDTKSKLVAKTFVCTLEAGADSDRNVIRLEGSGERFLDNVAIPFQAVQEFRWRDPIPPNAPLHDISLSCRSVSANTQLSFRFAKIMAIRLDGSLCKKPSPAICSDTASDVLATFKESGAIKSETPIVTLKVPGGLYAVSAKINLDQDDTTKWVTVVCTLRSGLDVDRDVIRLLSSSPDLIDNATIPLQLVQILPTEELNDIELSCKFDAFESSLLSFRSAKITAIRVRGNRCEKASPADCLTR